MSQFLAVDIQADTEDLFLDLGRLVPVVKEKRRPGLLLRCLERSWHRESRRWGHLGGGRRSWDSITGVVGSRSFRGVEMDKIPHLFRVLSSHVLGAVLDQGPDFGLVFEDPAAVVFPKGDSIPVFGRSRSHWTWGQ